MTPGVTDATWIEVDAAALRHNLQCFRDLLPATVRLMAVVKANAYGHGWEAARVFADGGADMLAVSTLQEALAIRALGVTTPILIFVPLLPHEVAAAGEADLTITISSPDHVRAASSPAGGRPLRVHLKIDVGMGRLGVLPEQAVELARKAQSEKNLMVEGIYAHLPCAGEDATGTRRQVQSFRRVLDQLSTHGLRPPIAHCANSAAALLYPESHLDMVRPGTALFGQFPSSKLSGAFSAKLTWRLFSRVVDLKEVPRGWYVGYGSEFRAARKSRLAVVRLGYADGFGVQVNARSGAGTQERLLGALKALRGPAPAWMMVEGVRVPVAGRIGMQMTVLDVTDAPDIRIGSTVEAPCRRVTSNPDIPRRLVERVTSGTA